MSYLNSSAENHVDHGGGPNKWVVLLILALVAGGGYVAYTKFAPKKAPPATAEAMMKMPPAKVVVYPVKHTDVPLSFEYSGRTAGSREVQVRPRVSGILLRRAYTEGKKVTQGDVLFEIDPAPFMAELQQAQARFDQAEKDWERGQKLFKAKALSARESDQVQSAYEQAKAALAVAKINLGYTTVIAPVSGVTSKESVSEGSLVVADNTLLTRVTRLDPIYVNFSTPDEEVLAQRRMILSGEYGGPQDGVLQAEIHFGDGMVYSKTGQVNFTDSIIDPETGSVSNRAVLPNPDHAILPGQFVRVVVKGMVRKNAIAIPDRAVMQGPQGTFVYVVQDNTVAVKPVVLGALQDGMRFVKSGLEDGDQVVVEGMIKARPGAPVTIVDPNEQQAEAVHAPAAKKE